MTRSGQVIDTCIDCAAGRSGEILERVAAVFVERGGYRAARVGPDRIQFARTFRPTWCTVLGVVLLPVVVGIFLLLMKTTETCTAALVADHRSTRIRIAGRIDPSVREELQRSLGEFRAVTPTEMASAAPTAVAVDRLQVHDPRPSTSVEHTPLASPVPMPPAQGGVAPGGGSVSIPLPAGKPGAGAGAGAEATQGPPRGTPLTLPESAEVGWSLELADGRRIPLSGRVHLGRDPVGVDSEPTALVSLDDSTRSVSKTHLAVSIRGTDIWIADMHSTNGTFVEGPSGEARRVPPGEWTKVDTGTGVRLGQYRVVLREGRP